MNIWAIIPVKLLLHSKSRLQSVLSAAERAELIQLLLGRTITILSTVDEIRTMLVVSRDPTILKLAKKLGARTISEATSDGLNRSVARGVEKATAEGASRALILPTDLPFITAEDVRLMLPDKREDGAVRLCSDEARQGTNALSLPLPTDFRFQFGEGSFGRHLQEVRRLERSFEIIQSPTLQFDLDNPNDWKIYRQNLLAEQC